MAESCGRKLVVEVCNAKNLMPKDGQGTASAYAIVDFDGQRRRTKTKFRDLNPEWDEKLEFLVHDKETMESEMLEVNLYNDKKTEKRSVFSQIKGELGLKVYYIDENPDPPAAEEEKKPPTEEEKTKTEEKVEAVPEKEEEKKKEEEEEKPKEEAAAAAKEQEEVPKPEEAPPAEVHSEKQQQQPQQQTNNKENLKPESGDVVVVGGLNEAELLRSLGSGRSRSSSADDLVDRMPFLYVRVVKVKVKSEESVVPSSSFYAKLVIGTHSIKTKKSQSDKDWDQVFAFDKEGLNSTSLDLSVYRAEISDSDSETSCCLGTVSFDLQEVPKRVPPDSPLAPQWYTLDLESENPSSSGSGGNDVMLAVWFGTQTDEAFQEAWQSDSGGLIPETRAKVYLSPKLWYLRLTVIQTQDLQLKQLSEPNSNNNNKVRSPDHYYVVKAQLGAQVFKTCRSRTSGSTANNPTWNEDLVFVAAEPFEPFLVVTVEDVSNGQQSSSVGHAKIQVASIERRIDDHTDPKSRWFNLVGGDDGTSYTGRIHVRVCLEGGYHVLDEAAHVTSDVRASSKQLAKPPIGLLEVGIRGATNLMPVKTKDNGTRGTIDAYVVAKYGPKWVRTRTIMDRFSPRWNEQYTWDVYDPCTVLTIGVFDNGRYISKSEKDVRIGKIRVRLSTLDSNRIYINSYPLTVLLPNGANKMGDIEIAVRFTCPSWLSLIQAYTCPMLPRMHYVRPMGPAQQDILRHTAMKIVTTRLARSEPALGQEVVQFMLDSDTHVWSMRRSKANWFRVVGCLTRAATLARWLDGIRTWVHPPTTMLVHVALIAIAVCPNLVLPTVFMYAFLIILLRFRCRQRVPLNIDTRLSYVEAVSLDELDEEFDGFPTTRSPEQVRIRYDRLRALAGRAQILLGDVAAQGERLEALFSWKDPRATGIFVVFCLFASLMFYAVPFKAFVLVSGFYYLRHPRFRHDMPSIPVNVFKRLPSLSDQIM
ncbi:hypothetical protein ACB092_09G154800 [Castanea dentata]